MLKDKKYWGGVIILLLFYFGHLFEIPFLRYAGLGMLGGMVLLFNPDELIYTYAFLLPNTYLIKINSDGAAIAGYFMILVLAKLLLMRSNRMFAFNMVLSLYLHIAVVAISIIWNGDKSFIASFIRFCAQIVLGVTILSENIISKEKLVARYITSNCFSVVLALIYNIVYGISNFNGNFASIGNDRNYFAITLVCALTIHVVHSTVDPKGMIRNIFQTVLLLTGVILSGSRTAFILLVIPLIVYIWSIQNLSAKRKIYLIVLIVIVMTVINNFLDIALLNIRERFASENLVDGNSRFDAWKHYITQLTKSFSSILLGCGSSTANITYYVVEHNTVIEALYTVGGLGLCTLLWVYTTLVKHGLRGRKINIGILPFLAIIIGYCTINGLYSDNLTFAITLSMVTVQMITEYKDRANYPALPV